MRGAALLLHGGGPTPVLNASLAGLVAECRLRPEITAVHGARFGVDGALTGDFFDLGKQTPALIAAIGRTPGSALGSSRATVAETDYGRLLDALRSHDIRYVFFNGGNGSMYTAHRLAEAAGDALRVIGIPKTIDNDIVGTDHTPGYGSAAWFFACAVRDIGEDIRALPGRVSVVEIMGRNAGWLTAATALARRAPGDPPHLIYLPETPLAPRKFLSGVQRALRANGTAVVAVCEGQTDERGRPLGDLGTPDGFGRRLSGNLAHTLARLLIDELGLNARSEKPGLLGRSSMAFVSETDWREAYLCGQAAVRAAVAGASGSLISLVREPGPGYSVRTELAPLSAAAGAERLFPREWIAGDGDDVASEFLDYAAPLLGPVAHYPRLVT